MPAKATLARPVRATRYRVDEEYSFSAKTVYRIVGGLAAVGGLLIALSLFTSGKSKAILTGHITHRGKPVIWGSVIVVGPDGFATSGRIEPDGSYTVANAPTSTVSLAIISQDPLVQHYATQIKVPRDRVSVARWEAPPVDRKNWFPLPKQYEDPKTSGLTVTLSRGKNLRDIDLP